VKAKIADLEEGITSSALELKRTLQTIVSAQIQADVREARRIVDLGCGPGNSAAVLAERWRGASIDDLIVLSVIEVARREHPHCSWMMGDIWDWAETEQARFDVVFSNAVLQWVPDHASLYPVHGEF